MFLGIHRSKPLGVAMRYGSECYIDDELLVLGSSGELTGGDRDRRSHFTSWSVITMNKLCTAELACWALGTHAIYLVVMRFP